MRGRDAYIEESVRATNGNGNNIANINSFSLSAFSESWSFDNFGCPCRFDLHTSAWWIGLVHSVIVISSASFVLHFPAFSFAISIFIPTHLPWLDPSFRLPRLLIFLKSHFAVFATTSHLKKTLLHFGRSSACRASLYSSSSARHTSNTVLGHLHLSSTRDIEAEVQFHFRALCGHHSPRSGVFVGTLARGKPLAN